MKTFIILASLLILTNCTGGSIAKVKFGKRCTVADTKQLQESSYVWFISSDAVSNFDQRINKKNCLNSQLSQINLIKYGIKGYVVPLNYDEISKV